MVGLTLAQRRLVLFVVTAVAVLAVVSALFWRRHVSRPAGVPITAVLLDGQYIDCARTSPGLGEACKIYDGRSGKLLDTDPFSIRLRTFSKQQGGSSTDCGKTPSSAPDKTVAECVQAAFGRHSSFTAQYVTNWGTFTYAYGIAGDASGNVAISTYDSRGFPDVIPNKRTQLLDGNRVRFTSCVQPVVLGVDADGVAGCVTPVDEAVSAAKQLKPVDTTICAITANPAAFNNRLVRVKGSYSGNFEYAMLSQDGCPSIWFEYASAEDSPPGLAIYVPGAAMPGAEDEKGWRISPLTVSLVRDDNFRRFQKLMKQRVEVQERAKKRRGEFVSYRVTATFIGRIDGVPQQIHEFHKRRSDRDRADFLGFGQMGLFDAQLIMQSVEGDAVLEKER